MVDLRNTERNQKMALSTLNSYATEVRQVQRSNVMVRLRIGDILNRADLDDDMTTGEKADLKALANEVVRGNELLKARMFARSITEAMARKYALHVPYNAMAALVGDERFEPETQLLALEAATLYNKKARNKANIGVYTLDHRPGTKKSGELDERVKAPVDMFALVVETADEGTAPQAIVDAYLEALDQRNVAIDEAKIVPVADPTSDEETPEVAETSDNGTAEAPNPAIEVAGAVRVFLTEVMEIPDVPTDLVVLAQFIRELTAATVPTAVQA